MISMGAINSPRPSSLNRESKKDVGSGERSMYLSRGDPNLCISISPADPILKIWDLKNGVQTKECKLDGIFPSALMVLDDCKTLIWDTNKKSIFLYNFIKEEMLCTKTFEKPPKMTPTHHTNCWVYVEMTEELAVFHETSTNIILIDLETGKTTGEIKTGWSKKGQHMLASRDGSIILSKAHEPKNGCKNFHLCVFDTTQRKKICELKRKVAFDFNPEKSSLSEDGRYFITHNGAATMIEVWDICQKTLRHTIKIADDETACVYIASLAVTSQGGFIVACVSYTSSGTNQKELYAFHLKTSKEICHIPVYGTPYWYQFSADHKMMLTETNPGKGFVKCLALYDIAKLKSDRIIKKIASLKPETDTRFAYLSQDGKTVYVGLAGVEGITFFCPRGDGEEVYENQSDGDAKSNIENVRTSPKLVRVFPENLTDKTKSKKIEKNKNSDLFTESSTSLKSVKMVQIHTPIVNVYERENIFVERVPVPKILLGKAVLQMRKGGEFLNLRHYSNQVALERTTPEYIIRQDTPVLTTPAYQFRCNAPENSIPAYQNRKYGLKRFHPAYLQRELHVNKTPLPVRQGIQRKTKSEPELGKLLDWNKLFRSYALQEDNPSDSVNNESEQLEINKLESQNKSPLTAVNSAPILSSKDGSSPTFYIGEKETLDLNKVSNANKSAPVLPSNNRTLSFVAEEETLNLHKSPSENKTSVNADKSGPVFSSKDDTSPPNFDSDRKRPDLSKAPTENKPSDFVTTSATILSRKKSVQSLSSRDSNSAAYVDLKEPGGVKEGQNKTATSTSADISNTVNTPSNTDDTDIDNTFLYSEEALISLLV